MAPHGSERAGPAAAAAETLQEDVSHAHRQQDSRLLSHPCPGGTFL